MQTLIGLMTSQIHLILTNDGPPLVELVKVLRLQNILKSYDTSSLKTADTYGAISMVDSTGNAPKSTSTQPVRYIFADDVYTTLEQISAKEAMNNNSNKKSPKTAHTSDYHGGRHHFLSEIKNFAEGFVGFRFNNNYDL
jgi:hypothetical protein